MQRTEPVRPNLHSVAQRRTLRLAWITIFGFFGLFLLLAGWAFYAGRQFYLSATNLREATLVVRGPTEWVSWQPANRSIFQGIHDKQVIGEGDSVRVVTKAGYGQIASIRLFDESQIDLWAGADLRLDILQTTRWSDRLQEVTIRQSGGYARYDLRIGQPYRQVRFRVVVGDATIDLMPGGSYSVALQPPTRIAHVTPGASIQPFTVDVAVRSGRATVNGVRSSGVVLGTRQRVEIDQAGVPGLAVPARWELIRDGGFSQFSEAEYNNTTLSNESTLLRSTSWQVYSGPPLPAQQQGFFRLSSICKPPMVDNTCASLDRRTAAWLYRAGGQTSGFTTGIRQQLGQDGGGVDISEYRSLTFSLWARVIAQSIEDVGDRGTECPVMIRILARQESPDDADQERVVCIYTDANTQPPRVRADDVLYYQVPKATWIAFRFNLRDLDWLPDYRYLQAIQIYANGHDYNAMVADVSLVGEQ